MIPLANIIQFPHAKTKFYSVYTNWRKFSLKFNQTHIFLRVTNIRLFNMYQELLATNNARIITISFSIKSSYYPFSCCCSVIFILYNQ